MIEQQPSVGRIVHYVAFGTPGGEFPAGVCRAAIITGVGTGTNVSLAVFNPNGQYFDNECFHDPAKAPGTWHWPERV